MKTLSSKFFPYLLVFGLALVVRLAAHSFWLESPFTEYHLINGLDMMTHMRFGLDFANGNANFSLHKLLCWGMIKLSGEQFPVKELILFQHLIGSLVPVFVMHISLRMSGDKFLGILAGLLTALYSPLVMYESFPLVESLFLFVSAAALLVSLSASPTKPLLLMLSGAIIVLPATVRFSGIFLSSALGIWFALRLMRKKNSIDNKKFIKTVGIFLAGSVLAAALVGLINFINSGELSFFPGKPVVSYIFKSGSQMKINPEDDLGAWSAGLSDYSLERKAASYLSKVIDLIRPYEIPNNLNYYFVKNQFPILKYLIGPLLLIPMGVSGLLVSLARPSKARRFSIMFFYFIAIAAPMIVFLPLARYRLALVPFFAFFAAYYISSIGRFLRTSQERPMPLLLSLLTYVVVLTWSAPSSFPLRSEDFLAYGEAITHKKGNEEEILLSYLAAYGISPESRSVVSHLADHLMNIGNFVEAKNILEKYCNKYNDASIKTMLAASMLGVGDFFGGRNVLLSIPEPKDGKARVNHFYQLGEASRLMGNKDEALLYYETALRATDDESQSKIIKSAIERLGL
ncbi:MAG TPA: hypothetical protein PK821_06225 [Victivallales bacterium]|nr:hypothetical protein [Victivallales bacterium]